MTFEKKSKIFFEKIRSRIFCSRLQTKPRLVSEYASLGLFSGQSVNCKWGAMGSPKNREKPLFSRKNLILTMTSRDFLKQIFVRNLILMSFTYTSHLCSQKEIFAYLTRISHRSPPNYIDCGIREN